MGKIRNMTIKKQVFALAIILGIFLLILGINGIVSTSTIADSYDKTLININGRNILSNKMEAAINGCRSELYYMLLEDELGEDIEDSYNLVEAEIDNFFDLVDQYQDNIDNDNTLPDATRATLQEYHDNTYSDVEDFQDMAEQIKDICINGGDNKADDALKEQYIAEMDTIIKQTEEDVDAMVEIAELRINEAVVRNKAASQTSTIVAIVLLIAAIALGIVFAGIIATAIASPLKKVANAAVAVSRGDFNVDTRSNLTNEVGQIANSFSHLTDTLKSLFDDMQYAFMDMSNGNLDAQLPAGNYEGDYSVIANNVNDVLTATASDYYTVIDIINEYANGNFNKDVPVLPGKKAELTNSFNFMKHQCEEIINTVDVFISAVEEGRLDVSVDDSSFRGDWRKIVLGFATFADIVTNAVKGTKDALNQMAVGNFAYRVDRNKYNGEFREMADNINTTSSSISDYVFEISDILTKMAHQNLDVTISREYIGDFAQIKDSLELIIGSFNKLIEEIILSSEQVAIGSNSIADSSTNLAQGASQQASAVEELTATIGTVADATSKNIELVLESNDIAVKAQESVERVRKEMQDLLDSMREINESSKNISAVLQVIDDIAFQTNILALNAAVEAARAGEQGKGFAIVAEEVRNLAARSQEAAKNSSELIEVSVEKAEQGSLIADRTAETINDVTSQIEKISQISNSVADIYKEQNKSINEINIGINQISEVVSANTATSEESAAASEELASQSAVFKEMVARFKIKHRRGR